MAEWVISVIDKVGAAGIALLMLLENVFPPIPSELIMPFAGFHAARRGSGFWVAVIAGSAGSLVGTGLWYLLAVRIREERFRSFLRKHGRWVAMNVDDLRRAKQWFARHGGAAVFLCRLVPGLRTLISVPAGFCRMPAVPFLTYSAAGTFLWTIALAFLGERLGENYDKVSDYVGYVSNAVFGIMLGLYLWRVFRWTPGEEHPAEGEPEGCG
jgi:membrane protein DedA with SNARE-associated domain